MLSLGSLEILLDLVEIKLSTMIISDKDDLKEFRKLKACKKELLLTRREQPWFKSSAEG